MRQPVGSPCKPEIASGIVKDWTRQSNEADLSIRHNKGFCLTVYWPSTLPSSCPCLNLLLTFNVFVLPLSKSFSHITGTLPTASLRAGGLLHPRRVHKSRPGLILSIIQCMDYGYCGRGRFCQVVGYNSRKVHRSTTYSAVQIYP